MASAIVKHKQGGLAKYDPEKGVKKIRLLEAVQKHWTKARDASKLKAAIEAKWNEQGEFVFWWDTQAEKDPGIIGAGPGRGHKVKRGSNKNTTFNRLEDYGLVTQAFPTKKY